MAKKHALQRRVLARLASEPECWAVKLHSSPFQRAGLPDVVGCWRGRLFALELKGEEKELPSPRQQYELNAIRRAGGATAVIHRFEELEEWWHGFAGDCPKTQHGKTRENLRNAKEK